MHLARAQLVLQVRLAVLELLVPLAQVLLVPLAQVLLEHLEGWERSVPRERLVPLVLGELVAQLVRSGPRALWARLAVLELLVAWAQVLLEHLAG